MITNIPEEFYYDDDGYFDKDDEDEEASAKSAIQEKFKNQNFQFEMSRNVACCVIQLCLG